MAQTTTRSEVAYGVTSLIFQAAFAERRLELVRHHRGTVNGLYYRRDFTFHEDADCTKSWNLAQARRHYGAPPDEALRSLCALPA